MHKHIFSGRSLYPEITEYCLDDVNILPALRAKHMGRIGTQWLVKAKEASECRATEARSFSYGPNSESKIRGP